MTERVKMLSICFVIATLWMIISMYVGYYAMPTRHPDGFQSIGASFGNYSGQLGWSFLMGFENCDRAWGYHWFGWPLIRSLLAPFLPFSPLGDAFLLHILRIITALLVANFIFRNYASKAAAVIGCAAILLQKGWFCSMAFLYRPETITALVLWLAAEPLWGPSCEEIKRRKWLSQFALICCPTLHPLALLAAGLVVVLGIYRGKLIFGQSYWCLCKRWVLPYIAGLIWFAIYYGLNPIRFDHLLLTIMTMGVIKQDFPSVVKMIFFDLRNIFFNGPMMGVFCLLLLGIYRNRDNKIFFPIIASLSFLFLGIGYLIVSGHPNAGHASIMAPFLGLFFAQVYLWGYGSKTFNWLACSGITLLVVFCTIPLLLVATALLCSEPQSQRYQAVIVLNAALSKTEGKVLIPLSLWEAALMLDGKEQERIRFATFPNFALRERRDEYERMIVESLSAGDILIQDSQNTDVYDQLDVYPWPRHPQLRNSAGWEQIAEYPSLFQYTIRLGMIEKKEEVLGALKISRYLSLDSTATKQDD